MANDPNHDDNQDSIDSTQPESSPTSGNRPAQNALRASAETELNKSWQGGEGAADFLGLDQEVGRMPEPEPVVHFDPYDDTFLAVTDHASNEPYEHDHTIPLQAQAPAAPESDSHATSGPQFESHEPTLQAEQAGEIPHAGAAMEEDDQSWLMGAEDSDLEQDAQAPEYFDDLEAPFATAESSSGGLRLVAMAGLLAITAGGVWYFGLRSKSRHYVDTPVADATPAPVPTIEQPVPVSDQPDSTTGVPETSEPMDEGKELLAELAGLIKEAESASAPGLNSGPESGMQDDGESEGGSLASATDQHTQGPVSGHRVERVVELDPSEMTLVPDYSSSLRLASESEMASLWPETSIPTDKFDGAQRLLTPKVGRVRVVITGDEIFEGTLYAVGQHQVWLDSKIGRVALDSATIHDVQSLDGTERTPELGGKGSETLAGLPRVRVRGAGGNFYGKIVARDGDRVTLIPDSGGRIRIESREVEIVGHMRSSLVRADGE